MDAMKHFTEGMIKENKPQFEVGDTVRVSVRIKEGDKERIQAFEGTVIAKKHGGIAETFTVRRTSYGVGVERVFPVNSPFVEKVDVVRRGKVRRAKLFYLRERTGKAAKVKARIVAYKKRGGRLAFSFFSYFFKRVVENRAPSFKDRYRSNKETLEWYDALAMAVAVIALVFTFGVRIVKVDGHSMDPTLSNGERILINLLKKPDYDDIVVVDGYTEYGRPLVKRVIGKGGDTIDIDFTAGIVYRNGEALDEPYTAEPTYLYESVDFPITVPDGCLFLMGDNRNNSTDSRDTRVGCVDERDIMGAAVLRVLPFGKIGAAQ